MAVLTVTFTVPDSHETMLEVLEMNSTQVSLVAFDTFVGSVIDGSQRAEVEFDLDGSPVVTIPE